MVKEILKRIAKEKDCIVLPPSGLPNLSNGLMLPLDLEAFYQICGGIHFFISSNYAMEIVSPKDFLLSNNEILPKECLAEIPDDDISNNFYIVAASGPEQKISIDLSSKRLGWCYDSFWDVHATPDSEILAHSFTQLLENIYHNKGAYWFWLQSNFTKLGGAYD